MQIRGDSLTLVTLLTSLLFMSEKFSTKVRSHCASLLYDTKFYLIAPSIQAIMHNMMESFDKSMQIQRDALL